ncbi:MAG: hypothetical protein P8R42_25920 [Candidatus Binatia bacterium]|nr:hypothetical protein [Candidatus Binatia bacterium]
MARSTRQGRVVCMGATIGLLHPGEWGLRWARDVAALGFRGL